MPSPEIRCRRMKAVVRSRAWPWVSLAPSNNKLRSASEFSASSSCVSVGYTGGHDRYTTLSIYRD